MSTIAQTPETLPSRGVDLKAHPPGPCLMVIFGASGDLTKRKLIPALYNLDRSNYLPENFAVVGFAYDPMSTEQFRDSITKAARELSEVDIEDESWDRFVQRLYYMQGDCSDQSAYDRLRQMIEETDGKH